MIHLTDRTLTSALFSKRVQQEMRNTVLATLVSKNNNKCESCFDFEKDFLLYYTSTSVTALIESSTTSTATLASAITTITAAKIPISNFAIVTASNFVPSAGSPTAQGDGLVNRINSTGGTYFNSGGYPPQYIQLELPGEYNISYVCLQVAQSPTGTTTHLLYVGSALNNLTLVTTFNGQTSSAQWINTTYDPPLIQVRFLRLNSISSPSWIAWIKFIVYDH